MIGIKQNLYHFNHRLLEYSSFCSEYLELNSTLLSIDLGISSLLAAYEQDPRAGVRDWGGSGPGEIGQRRARLVLLGGADQEG
jgi:hypothetical protein